MIDLKFANPGSHRGLSTHLWRDIPKELILDKSAYLAHGLSEVDDFNYVSSRYTVTQATSGTFAASSSLGEGGWAVADTGAATADQGPNVQDPPWIAPEVGYPLVFETRIVVDAVGTPGNIFLGLSESDTTVLAAGALTPNSYIGFKALGTLGVSLVRRKDGGAEQASSSTITTLVADTEVRLGFRVETDGSVVPYVNGVAVPDGKLTGTAALPTEILGRTLAVHSEGTTQPTVAIDYWGAAKKKTYLAA